MSNSDQLLSACQKGNLALVRRLVEEEGVSVDHSNGIRQSALHIAAWWSRSQVIEYLLFMGASLNGQNTITGATPLHCVFQSAKANMDRFERLRTLSLLLEAGADPRAIDFGGRTPIDYLDQDDQDREVIITFFKRYAPSIPDIFQALKRHNWDAMKRIIIEDPSSASFVHEGQTPFFQLITEWCGMDYDDGRYDEDAYDFYAEAIHGMIDLLTSNSNSSGSSTNGEWMSTRLAPDKKDSSKTVTAVDILCQTIMERYRMTMTQENFGQEIDDDAFNDMCGVVDRLIEKSSSTSSLQPEGEEEEGRSSSLHTEVTEALWLEIARRNMCIMGRKLHSWNVSYDVVNRQGMSTMQFAARSGNLQMVQLLVEINPTLAQKQIHQTDKQKTTPLKAAEVNGHETVLHFLNTISSSSQSPSS